MLTDEEKRLFARSTLRPMADHTMPCLTQVVGAIDDETGEHRGTGIFCIIDGQEAVVTAAHVLQQMRTAGEFVGVAFTRGSGEPPAIVAGKIRYFEDVDLAVYLPSKDYPLGKESAFWPAHRIERDVTRAATDYLFVQGFPKRFSRFTTLGGRAVVSESLAYGAMMRYRSIDIPCDELDSFIDSSPDDDFLPNDFLKPHQFAFNFEFDPSSFIGQDGIAPETRGGVIKDYADVFVDGENQTFPGQRSRGVGGLSGSPVWRIGAPGRPIRDWTPAACELVGIVTQWNQARRVLIATSAARLFDLAPEF